MTRRGMNKGILGRMLDTEGLGAPSEQASSHSEEKITSLKAKPSKKATKKKSKRGATAKGKAKPVKVVKATPEPITKVMPVAEILPRLGTPTRGIDPQHVVKLAASIQALGLIEPIAVDANGNLLAGAHRLAACRVLGAGEGERVAVLLEAVRDLSPGAPAIDAAKAWTELLYDLDSGPGELDPSQIPVRVFALSSGVESERSLAIEAAENEQRKDYTRKEVRALFERLVEAGYHSGRGRPKKGAKPALPAVATVIGKSYSHTKDIIRNQGKKAGTSQYSESYDRKRMRQAIVRYLDRHSKKADQPLLDALNGVVNLVDEQD